jgi:hypothetical protein
MAKTNHTKEQFYHALHMVEGDGNLDPDDWTTTKRLVRFRYGRFIGGIVTLKKATKKYVISKLLRNVLMAI